MSAVVGIDLGTTNTVVAHVEGGRATALADEAGERLIPSVVSFHPSGQVIVGRAAKERRLLDATNTVYSIKRLIGRAWDSPDVKRARSRFPFELREGPGHAVLCVARGETYTLSEISAYVLRKAKALAEAALGQPVERAVITVPANFNDLQRAATKVAGRVAGLEVLRILNEPTAAALAYGYGKANAERIAIYDFGGGTFDVTLLDLSGNVFEVLATAGDTFLGGDDVDLAIAERISESFLKEHRYDPRSDPQVFERVRAAAETIKHALSTETRSSVELSEIAFGPGGRALSSTFTMTRAELEGLIRPLVDRTFNVCKDALTTARATPKDFDQIILVGGSTRIPLVRQRVAEFFGKEPMGHVSPDEVVAIGAAIQAMALTAHERRRGGEGPGSNAPTGARPRTLDGLGEQAAAAQGRKATDPGVGARRTDPGAAQGTTTARGLGAAARSAAAAVGGDPGLGHAIIAPKGVGDTSPGIGGGVGAATERAPSTAEYDRKPAAGRAPPAPPVPARPAPPPPAPRKPPPPDAATKLSLGAEAQKARSATTEDSVMDALPLIGGAPKEDAVGDSETTLTRDRAGMMLDEPTKQRPAIMLEDPTKDDATLRRGAPQVPPPTAFEDLALPPSDTAPIERPQARPQTRDPFEDVAPPLKFDRPPPLVQPPAIQKGAGQTQVLAAMSPPAEIAEPRRPTGGLGSTTPLVQPPPGLGTTMPLPQQPPQPAPAPLHGLGSTVPLTQLPSIPPAPQIQEMRSAAAPLLVDVTPLSLSVETVGGYCDVIIARNTPVPCDRTRVFVTAKNYQRVVKIRVAQGESARFGDNIQLGELELSGLREGLRGDVEIVVTFEIDSDGILQVRAKDSGTGHEARAQLRLKGLEGSQSPESMRARQARQVVV